MWKSSFFLNAKRSTNDPKRKRNSLKSAGYFAREKESWRNGPILRSKELWNWPTFAPRYSIVNIYGYICTGGVSVLVVLARKNCAVQQFTTRPRSFRFCSSPRPNKIWKSKAYTWVSALRVSGSDTVLRSLGFRHKHASGLSSRYHRHGAILRLEENHLPLRLPRW